MTTFTLYFFGIVIFFCFLLKANKCEYSLVFTFKSVVWNITLKAVFFFKPNI